jgi:hypothetical protein
VERNPNLDSRSGNPQNGANRPFRSLRRLSAIGKRPDGRNGELIEALEADALLLREENARLRVKLEAAPDPGHVIERLRLLPTGSNKADGNDDAWQMLTDVSVMRTSLIAICQEIGQVMAKLERSLEALTPPVYEGDEHRGNAVSRNLHRRNGHPKEASAQ